MDYREGHRAPLNYHRVLIEDATRMDGYERAIRARVRAGDVVLDLGCGTGILAMLAARAGAARVHAVESMEVAEVARELVRRNGLEGRVIVHREDARTLQPVEPVDLIVSDFLGRFLVDDGMLPAVAAAARWLKPGGGFCPSRVRLIVAPAGNHHVDAIDTFASPVYGLDLSAVIARTLRQTYHVTLHPSFLLAEPATFVEVVVPEVPAFDATMGWAVARAGELRGLAGWFEATLAPGNVLSTAPGVETHWGQLLFPLPPTMVEVGDRLEARIALVGESAEEGPIWRWTGRLLRREKVVLEFDLESQPGGGEPIAPGVAATADRATTTERNARAAAAFSAGRLAEAAGLWEQTVRELAPGDGDLAGLLYENLGLAWYNLGRDAAAIRAFLRSLDGDLASRPQSLRFLVEACARAGRHIDAARYREVLERSGG